jgi:GT2 family glycosyltransferase
MSGELVQNIVVVICTKDRYRNIELLLDNLNESSMKPASIYVIDSSKSPERIEFNGFKCETVQIICELNSLPRQRNLFLDTAIEKKLNIEYVCFLDDDTFPKKNYLEQMVDYHEIYRDYVGLAPICVNPALRNRESTGFLKLQKFFGIDSEESGRLLKSGANIGLKASDKNKTIVESQWITGVAVWKYNSIRNTRFPEEFMGSGLFEDVWFSHTVSKIGKIGFCPLIEVEHIQSSIGRDNPRKFYRDWVYNRYLLVKKVLKAKNLIHYHLLNCIFLVKEFTTFNNSLKIKFQILAGFIEGYSDLIIKKIDD